MLVVVLLLLIRWGGGVRSEWENNVVDIHCYKEPLALVKVIKFLVHLRKEEPPQPLTITCILHYYYIYIVSLLI